MPELVRLLDGPAISYGTGGTRHHPPYGLGSAAQGFAVQRPRSLRAAHSPVFFGREVATDRARGKLRQAEAAGISFCNFCSRLSRDLRATPKRSNTRQAATARATGRVAKATAQRILELDPLFTVGQFLASRVTSPERLAPFGDALRQAGLPE
jgi:hypothetical protein